MNNISITPKGGTVDSVVNGSQVNLTAPSVVKLHLNQSDIKSFTRNGNDLVVTTKSGEVLVIHNFYTAAGDSDLVLQDDKGALWWVEDPGTEGFQYVNIDSTEGLLAENTTNDGTIAAFGIGGAALAGLGAMFAGSSGGGGGNAPANEGNTGGGDNGGGNNGGGNNGGGNNGGGNNGGGDTTAPSAATNLTLTDNVGTIQGAIVTGTVTDDNTPTLTGTAEAGATVSVYDGSTLLGTVVVGADGTWSFTSPALADGQHSLTTTVTDAAGNTSAASDPITFTVDTIAPAAAAGLVVSDDVGGTQGALAAGSTTDDNTPTLSGTAEPGTYISVYDGTTLLGTATVGADGTWSFTTPALSNGAHSLTVTVTDAAGNVSSATDPFNFSVTADLPPATTTLEITDDTGSTLAQLGNGAYTHDSTPVLSGLATAGAVITLYDGETVLGSVVAGADGQWVFTPAALADGSHAFHASITDASGTTQSDTITINIDTVAPDAASDLQLDNDSGSTVVPIAAGGDTNDNTPTLSGTAEPGSVVTIRDGDTVLGSVTVGSNGSWQFTSPTLNDGAHSLTTTVTDPAGNVSAPSSPIDFTVDTGVPAAATGLTVTDDVNGTQVLTSGAVTDDNTPTLAGQAEPGTVVSVYDNNTLLGTVTVGADGSWSFTTAALSNGAHSLTVTVTDAAGNVSQPTTAFDLTVDAALPPATSSLEVIDDTGSTLVQLADGASTHDNTPTLSGLAGANDTITLYNGDVIIGNTTADANGQWQFDTSNLPDGTYAFKATATDGAGVSTDSPVITITIDTLAPAAATNLQLTNDDGSTPVAVAAGGATNDITPVLSGNAEPGSTVTILDGTTVLGTATVGQDGTWSFTTPTLTDGSHSLTTTVTDPAGNVGPASNPFTFTVDSQPPAAAGDLQLSNNSGSTIVPIASGGTTNADQPVLSGTAEPGSTVTISDGTEVLGSVTVGANGSWSFTSPVLQDGSHSLTTTVTDAAGNIGPISTPINFSVDTTPPAVIGDLVVSDNVGDQQGELASNDTTDDNTPTLSGTTEAGALVSIYDGTVLLGNTTADQNGSWTFTTPALNNGTHNLSVTVTDTAGNVSDPTPNFQLNVEADLPPATTTLQITDDSGSTLVQLANGASTHDTSPILSGLAQAGDTITLYDGTQVLGTAVANDSGQWSFATTGLSEGPHTFYASITDVTGNTTNSPSITITVDTTQPDAASDLVLSNDSGSTPVPIAPDGVTNDSSPLLSGAGEPGATVSVYDGSTLLGTATVGSNGNWSFNTPALGEGNHSLTTTVTDAAGNVSDPSPAITFSVDTVAPAASSVVVGTDGGSLTSGATTDDNTLDLSGQSEANAVIRVYDGTVLLGSAVADTNGAWTFSTAALTNGNHSLTVTATDVAGNLGPATSPFVVNVEAGLPAATLTLEVTDDSGNTLVALADGDSTQDTTPVLSGLAIANAVVTLYDGTTVLGTAVADANGQWNFTPTALPDGAHAFQSSFNDAGGIPVLSPVITVTIDTIAPAPATDVGVTNGDGDVIPPGGSTNDTSPVLSGSAEPGSTVTITDGTTVLGTATVDENGGWTFTTPPLTEGNHDITTTVTDPAGNTSPASDPVSVVIDTQPPAAPGNVQLSNNESGTPVPITNGATNDTTPVLTGTAEPGSTVTVSDNGTPLGTATVGTDGTWSYSPTLDPGDHSLTATVTDPAGNVSNPSAPIAVNVDTIAPDASGPIVISNDQSGTPVPITNGTTNDTTPVLSGTAEPGSTVTVSDGTNVLGSVSVGSDGNWSYTTPALSEGNHTLSATVTDAAGNSSTTQTSVTISVDVTPPAAATDVMVSNGAGTEINSGGATNDTTPVISGSAAEGSTVNIYNGTELLGTATVGDGGTWTFTPTTGLGEGQHSITATVVDPAGNTSAPSTPVIVNIDLTPPAAAGDLVLSNDSTGTAVPVTNGATNDTTPVLSGTAEPGSVVIVTDTVDNVATVLGSTTVGTDGTWTFTPPAPLEEGAHSLTTTVTDPAGNRGDVSEPVDFTVDLTPPAVAGDVALNNNNNPTALVPIEDGGATNDTTPVLSGTAPEGSVITVYDGTNVLGTVVVDATGEWSYTTAALSQGEHSLSTTVTDPAGNVSDPSATIGFTVDTVPPAAATELQLTNGANNPIATGGATNDTTPTLTGTAEVGSTVTVTDTVNGVVTTLGTATVDGDGRWTFTPADDLPAGAHTLAATVTDPAGNTSSASSPINFTVDLTAPAEASELQLSNNQGSTPVDVALDGSTNDTTPVFSGFAEAGSVVTITDTVNGAATVLGSVTADADGNWSFTSPTLVAGDHSLTTTVTDPAGNVSGISDAFTFTVDLTPPAPAGEVVLVNDANTEIQTDGRTNDTTPTLSGSAEQDSIVTIRDGDTVLGTAITDGDGNWTFTTPTLSESSHSLTATVTDAAGNSSTPSTPIVFTVDITPPAAAAALVFSNDSGNAPVAITNGITNDNTPVLSGTAEAGSTVTISDANGEVGTALVGQDGTWSFDVPKLADGNYSFTTTVTDVAGNTGPVSSPIAITILATPPADAIGLQLTNNNGASPVIIADDGRTNDTTPVLSGTAAGGSYVTISEGGVPLGTAIVGSDGSWSFNVPTLSETTHTFTTVVTDAAGNVSSGDEGTFTVTIDVTPPDALTGLSVETAAGDLITGATNDTAPVLNGTAEVGSLVTIYDGDNAIASVTVTDPSGAWSYDFAAMPLTEGNHTLSATATDVAGNVSGAGTPLTVTIDLTPPAISSLVVTDDNGNTPVTVGNNGYTNDTSPEISGTAEPGSSVAIYDGQTLLATVPTDPDTGAWSYTADFASGTTHALSVVVTDAAGNLGLASDVVNITVSTEIPDAVVDLTVSNNNGNTLVTIPDEGSTNDTTPQLSGTSTVIGGIITITAVSDTGTLDLGTATVGADGKWSFITSALAAGQYSVSVTVTDAAGNVSNPSNVANFTVDITAPDAVTNLQFSNDSSGTAEPIASGTPTNDTTPLLQGNAVNAENGSIVTISENGTVLGTATVTDGAWSFNTPALGDGTHTFSVSVTDPAGNVSTGNPTISVIIDTQTPAAATDVTLSNDVDASNVVVIPNGGLTNDNTPVLTGQTDAGNTVTVSINGGTEQAATVNPDGSWSFTPAQLADGTYTFSVVVTSPAGNVSAPVTTVAQIDATPPADVTDVTLANDNGSVPVTTADITYTSDSTPVISGSATAGLIVNIYNNGSLLGTTTVGSDGKWSFIPTTPLVDDAYSITARAVDAAGNLSNETAPLEFTVDTIAPLVGTVTITDNDATPNTTVANGGYTNDTTPLLTGSGSEAGDTVSIYDTNQQLLGTAIVQDGGGWTFQLPTLSATQHTLTVTVTDEIGNSSSTSVVVNIDTTAPEPVAAVTIESDVVPTAPVTVANGGSTNDTTPTISGTAEPGSTITLLNADGSVFGTATADATTGEWSFTPTTALVDGTFYALSITATDAAGNVSVGYDVSFTIDTDAPTLGAYTVSNNNGATPVAIANNGLTNDDTPVLRGTGASAGSIITISDTTATGTTVLGTAIVADNGQWRFETGTLPQGTNTFTVTATDAAGNVTTSPTNFVINVDSVAPAAPDGVTATTVDEGNISSGGTTTDNVITFGGSTEAGSVVTIYDGTTVLGTATVTGTTWTFTTPTLSNGSHSFTATATDAAGNVSDVAPNPAFTQTVNAGVPDADTTLVITDDSGSTPVTLEDGDSTKDTTPVLSGQADALIGLIITIQDNGVTIGTVIPDPLTGQWNYTPTLGQGAHVITVLENGVLSAGPVTITVDSIAPDVVTDLVVNNNSTGTNVPVTSGSTNDNTPVLTGTAEPGAIITVYDGNTALGTTVATGGVWSFATATLTSGSHSFSVTATDAVGNVSAKSTAVPIIIDTIAPNAATLVVTNDDANPDLAVPNGGSTNDTTPVLSGTAEAGALIRIYQNNVEVGSTVATGGTWSYTSAQLGEGTYNFTVRATDAAGNTSVASSTATVVIDTTAPTGLTVTASNNNGTTPVAITNGGTTNDNTPALSGTAEPGSVVTISEGTTVLGSVTTAANGSWSFVTGTLPDGLHTLSITATDAAGNTGTASTVAFTVNTAAPTTPTLVVNNDANNTLTPVANNGATNDNTPTLTGTAAAGNVITIYDGTTVLGSTTAIAGDTWSFTSPTLTNGSHTFTIKATDALGNATAQVGTTTVTIDTVVPVASTLVIANDSSGTAVTVANGGSTNDTTPRLSGVVSTAEAGDIVRIYDNISGSAVLVGSAVVQADGSWSTNSNVLAEGNHPLSVTVTDLAGNVSGSTTASVIIDTTGPAVALVNTSNNSGSTLVTITNNSSTNDSTPLLSGTAEAGSVVRILDGTTVVGSVVVTQNGTWSIATSALLDGPHTLTVTATDAAGNVSTAAQNITFTVSTAVTAAPTLVVNNDANNTLTPVANNGVTNDSTPTLTGTAAEGNVITIYDGTTVLGTATAIAGNTWSFTSPVLSNGSHALSVTATNAAGTVSTAVSSNVVIDTVAPVNSTLVIANDNGTNPVTVANGGSTNDTTPRLSGVVSAAEAGGIVRIYDNISGTAVQVGSAVVQADGTWSTNSSVLATGTHPLSVTVTDAAGNVSGSTTASVIIDTTAPTGLTVAAANNNGTTAVPIANGGTTNDNTPALSGAAESGSLVIIRENGVAIGSTTAVNGTWSITLGTLSDATHTLSVTATDAAGNVGAASTFTLTVSTAVTAAPTLVVNNDANNTLTPVANNGVTNDSTPTLTGTAAAGNVITIYDGTTVLGTTTAITGNTWSFTSPALSNGSHALSVTATNAAGTVSTAVSSNVVIDTVAPVNSTLVIANDNGTNPVTVANGGSTNDTTPRLSGVVSTAEAGSIVRVYDNISGSLVQVGSAVVQADGSWSTNSSVLAQGTHPLSVTVTDAAGNISGSTTASVIIDTAAPTGLTVAAANNNGSTPVTVANGGFTNDNTPALSGSAEAGSVVIVRENGVAIGSTTATAGGTWSLTLTTLTDGLHTFSVTATDAAGNVGTASTIALNIDTGTPAIATGLTVTNNDVTPNVTVANGGSTNDNTPVLSGSAEANSIVTIYDGTTVLGSTTTTSGGTWSFTSPTLTNGSHPLSVTVKDAAGNISPASGTYTVVVDTVAPVASTLVITNDVTNTVVANGGSTNDTTPTLSGTVSAAEAGSRVSIYDNGALLGTAIVQANGSWSYTTTTLGAGTHPISVTVTDAAGNISSSTSASVIIDTTPPAAVTLVANNNNSGSNVVIPNNGATNDNTPLLTGTGEVGARVSVYDGTTLLGTTTVGSGGTWSFTTTVLSDGTHTLNVRQTDAAGNTSANVSTILTVDTVAPTASTLTITDDAGTTPVTLANGAYTRDTTPTLSGTAQAGAIVTILDGATVLGSVTAGTGGAWTFTTAALTNGAHTLSTTVTDAAGNVSTGNTTATVNVDTVAPAAVSGLAINAAGTIVTGSGEVGATVTVRDAGGAAIGTATVGTGGTWSVSLTTAQTTGATLSVTQADRAGNVSTSTSLVGAIRIVATNDTNEVDYSTTQGTINNGTTSVSHTALLTVGLGNVLNASVLSNGNAYLFSVGPDDTRTITLNGAVSSVGLLTNYSLNLYEQQANGTWLLVNSTTNYLGGLISIGTLKGANVTYTNLGTGTYAVVVASTVNVSLLPTTTISTVSDITSLAVTVAATVTGNLLTNDTSSIAGTVPTGTAVTAVSGSAVASSGTTLINTTYGTLTIDSHGNYTYALKAGLNIDTLPAADTFTYTVRDASGAVTSATLTVTLHNGAATSLTVSSLFAETTSAEHDASGSIYGDSTATHTGTLSITNEHGDLTTVSSTGTTSVAGDFGVLSIAANGSYTYTLNAGVDGQSLTHKETFIYTLAATDGTITTHSFTIDLHPTITGTTGADTITGGAYDDTITTGAGADTLVYHLLASADATGGNGHDTWTDFNVAQGDKIDVSNLLIGWNDSTSNINDFVKVDHTSDGNTVLSIDRDGTGTAYSSTQLVTLEGVNVSLEELLQQPHQNTTV
ncbi:Ig-like domain-containing protein [Candidatus Pantoea formicae]|uniref:Ig-like domain-containing protein n=1 Tax=Candidatus Pantoea formicae TaxID=2608355 RepID=UPI003ED8DAE8